MQTGNGRGISAAHTQLQTVMVAPAKHSAMNYPDTVGGVPIAFFYAFQNFGGWLMLQMKSKDDDCSHQ